MADIILKDPNGIDQTYTGISQIEVKTADGGKATFVPSDEIVFKTADPLWEFVPFHSTEDIQAPLAQYIIDTSYTYISGYLYQQFGNSLPCWYDSASLSYVYLVAFDITTNRVYFIAEPMMPLGSGVYRGLMDHCYCFSAEADETGKPGQFVIEKIVFNADNQSATFTYYDAVNNTTGEFTFTGITETSGSYVLPEDAEIPESTTFAVWVAGFYATLADIPLDQYKETE